VVRTHLRPPKLSQLDGTFETLIGDSGTIAGNHPCMLPGEGSVPGGQGRVLRPPGCAVQRQALAGAGSARGGRIRGVRPSWCACLVVSQVAGAPGGGPGDLAGRKTGSVLVEGRLPARQGCSTHSCRCVCGSLILSRRQLESRSRAQLSASDMSSSMSRIISGTISNAISSRCSTALASVEWSTSISVHHVSGS